MLQHLTIYYDKIKKILEILCDERSLEDIGKAYYAGEWCTKKEVIRFLEHEKEVLAKEAITAHDNYSLLLQNFNIGVHTKYDNL